MAKQRKVKKFEEIKDQIEEKIEAHAEEIEQPEEKEPEIAVILEDFTMQVPMPAHPSATCVMEFRVGDEITDPYIVHFLKRTSKPVNFY